MHEVILHLSPWGDFHCHVKEVEDQIEFSLTRETNLIFSRFKNDKNELPYYRLERVDRKT